VAWSLLRCVNKGLVQLGSRHKKEHLIFLSFRGIKISPNAKIPDTSNTQTLVCFLETIRQKMLNNLHEKVYFITGASGFVGTALTCSLICNTNTGHLHLLCRGGEKSVFQLAVRENVDLRPTDTSMMYGRNISPRT